MPRKPAPVGAPALKANVAQLRALAHPLRLRMVELFAEAPRTTKQVAEMLEQPPTRLYHHVALLERAGLLRVKETRKKRGTVEKFYEAVGRSMGSTGGGKRTAGDKSAQRAAVTAVLEQSRQESLAALGRADDIGPLLLRMVLVGSRKRAKALRARLLEMLKEIKEDYECDNTGDERWALTVAFAPVVNPE